MNPEEELIASGIVPDVSEDEDETELYECQSCGDMTPDIGTCFMCKETTI